MNVKDVDNGILMIKNRLHHKKILLVLDDVNELGQLNKLVAEHNWFGPGSRVIIKTEDVHLLMTRKVDGIYEIEGLSYDEVLGSFLYNRSTYEWKSELDRLKEFPEGEILNVLQISFDGLKETEKEFFLNYINQETIIAILDHLELYPKIGLRVLIYKSLIKLQNDKLWMHDLFQEMGRDIVRKDCPKDPGKRSRLWLYKDIDSVLTKNTGTETIQGIVLKLPKPKEAHWDPKSFSKMHRLKFLIIGNFQLSHDPKHLPNDLVFLDWSGYPSKSLPASFQPNEFIELHMYCSNIEQLWKGTKVIDNILQLFF
ncbi:disease resistance protein RUN1-like [Quercus robur]|uniref:disease resistance protein RUN1-like n=1 Tax=Quercus robur TaxID=38942 RepID=UPI002161B5D3|nr:disease resistance protein RUN1-like [Quercus robur]